VGEGAGGEGEMPQQKTIKFRDIWGTTKWQQLVESKDQDDKSLYQEVKPAIALGLPLKPRKFDSKHNAYPSLPEIFPTSFPGVKTSRDSLVVGIDQQELIEKMEKYFDPKVSHEEMRKISPIAVTETPQFKAKEIREQLQKKGFLYENIIRYCYRPFDIRWIYWEADTKLLDRNRAEYFPQIFDGNIWFTSTQRTRKQSFYQPQIVTKLSDLNIIEANVQLFPLYLKPEIDLFNQENDSQPQVNLSEEAIAYLDEIGVDSDISVIFYHTLAILHSPNYASENDGALRQDWARIPLPDRRETLIASANLGRQIAALLDPETPVPGVTSGKLRSELKTIAVVSRVGTGNLDPNADFALKAGWGHAGQNGVTMPGKGKVSDRAYLPEELSAVGAKHSAERLSETPTDSHPNASPLQGLGNTTHDIYLNDIAYWKNIPDRVWHYTIGGYQVIKKWLSYREQELLERPLKLEEVTEVTHMARRIAAILLLEPELDVNYQTVKQSTYQWSQEK
jgi:hypothetical protein